VNEKQRESLGFPDSISRNGNSSDPITILVCDANGENVHPIGRVPNYSAAAFWFDANRIAVAPSNDDNRYHLLSITGERLDDIVLPEGCDVLYKQLSADRNAVAFVGKYENAGEETHGVFTVDLAEQTVKPILIGAYKTAPAWSPDASRLAIGNGEGYVTNHELLIVDVLNGHVTKTGMQGVGADWSADGRYIAFTTELRAGGSWHRGIPVSGRIGFLDVASFDAYAITPAARLRESEDGVRLETSGAFGPLWSPNGRHIAYRETARYNDNNATEQEEITGICIANRDELGGAQVYEGDAKYAWSPDSRALYVLTADAIHRVDLPSLETRTLLAW
jgi:Tol biopolymer transport system component